jgi:hypothetical protein
MSKLVSRSSDKSHYLVFENSLAWDRFVDILDVWDLFTRLDYELNPPNPRDLPAILGMDRVITESDISRFENKLRNSQSHISVSKSFVSRWRIDI